MTWTDIVVICLIVTTACAINRPVYKVVLSQRGFTQFLQYDVETPPLKEFTFCTWFRTYDLSGDQSIFTYIANGDNRIVRLWLDSGGRNMKVSINGRVTSSVSVEFAKDVWRHVCLSYQSDYGAWALYIDAKLISCEVALSLYGYVLPKGGSLIIGYGTADNGKPSGLDGEIFGANMILSSTIENNITTKLNQLYEQKTFHQNKIKNNDNSIKYVVLNDLQTEEIHNNFEKTQLPKKNKSKNFIRLTTPYSHIEHDVGLDIEPKRAPVPGLSKEFLDFSHTDTFHTTTTEKNGMSFWNLVNKAGQEGKFRTHKLKKPIAEISGSSTRDLTMISEFETPPPPPPQPGQPKNTYTDQSPKEKIPAISKSIFSLNEEVGAFNLPVKQNKNKIIQILPDVETPPPPTKDTKVYGQWTSSKFAGSVLNYLKSINYHKNGKKISSTMPLTKSSDTYPYPSEFKISKLRPPIQFKKKKIMDRRMKLQKRGITDRPEINVQIVEEDLRSLVLKQHAQTQPKGVEITNRGSPVKVMDRFYRNIDDQVSKENSESEEEYKSKPLNVINAKQRNKVFADYEAQKINNLLTILPFLKSLEYFVDDSQNIGSENVIRSSEKDHSKNSLNMYSKSLSSGNKWHNVKSYSNDYTPRRINIYSDENNDLDTKIAEANKKNPSIRIKYKHENHKLVEHSENSPLLKARQLALSISNQSNTNGKSISLVKYNHGFLPSHDNKMKNPKKARPDNSFSKMNKIDGKANFNKNVKLGNALNERHVIGYNEQQKKQSFVGGDENIPDINRYRSDLDNENVNIPSSLGLRMCKNTDLDDRFLYVQPDLSIDTSHIISPVKKKNIGIEFIQQNYKKCSLDDSSFEKTYLLLIDWGKTPVRLFGGARPKTTTDLCGFF